MRSIDQAFDRYIKAKRRYLELQREASRLGNLMRENDDALHDANNQMNAAWGDIDKAIEEEAKV